MEGSERSTGLTVLSGPKAVSAERCDANETSAAEHEGGMGGGKREKSGGVQTPRQPKEGAREPRKWGPSEVQSPACAASVWWGGGGRGRAVGGSPSSVGLVCGGDKSSKKFPQ